MGGDIPFKTLTFPDQQPHIEILKRDEWFSATIEAAITSSEMLMRVLLAKDALDACGYVTSLDIRYLLGARMDRRIDARQPFTMAVIARTLMLAGFSRIRVLDPHSDMALVALGAEGVYPVEIIRWMLRYADPDRVSLVAPDAGAVPRVRRLLEATGWENRFRVIEGVKHRESSTGALSGFSVRDASVVRGQDCLIVDDLCDGGGTFSGLAAKLNEAGAASVDLYVTHGIFSKGITLPGVRQIVTTDSYAPWTSRSGFLVQPIRMSDL